MLVSKLIRTITVIIAVICHVVSFMLIHSFQIEFDNRYKWTLQLYVLFSASVILPLLQLFIRKTVGIVTLLIFRCAILIILGIPLGGDFIVVEMILMVSLLVSIGMTLPSPWNISFSVIVIAIVLSFQRPMTAMGATIAGASVQDIITFGLISSVIVFLSCYLHEKLNSEKKHITFISRLQRAMIKISEVNVGIQDHAFTVGIKSRVSERKIISREIHDSAGHILTTVLMMLKTSKLLVPKGAQNLEQILSRAINQTEEGIVEIRSVLHELRGEKVETVKGINAIHKLISLFSETTGVKIKTEYGNVPNTLGSKVDLFLYRFSQEALLNSFKHGDADKIQIYFWDSGSTINVSISDNGIGCKKIVKGIGISGMEERVEKLGGNIVIPTKENGFEICACIPWKGSVN